MNSSFNSNNDDIENTLDLIKSINQNGNGFGIDNKNEFIDDKTHIEMNLKTIGNINMDLNETNGLINDDLYDFSEDFENKTKLSKINNYNSNDDTLEMLNDSQLEMKCSNNSSYIHNKIITNEKINNKNFNYFMEVKKNLKSKLSKKTLKNEIANKSKKLQYNGNNENNCKNLTSKLNSSNCNLQNFSNCRKFLNNFIFVHLENYQGNTKIISKLLTINLNKIIDLMYKKSNDQELLHNDNTVTENSTQNFSNFINDENVSSSRTNMKNIRDEYEFEIVLDEINDENKVVKMLNTFNDNEKLQFNKIISSNYKDLNLDKYFEQVISNSKDICDVTINVNKDILKIGKLNININSKLNNKVEKENNEIEIENMLMIDDLNISKNNDINKIFKITVLINNRINSEISFVFYIVSKMNIIIPKISIYYNKFNFNNEKYIQDSRLDNDVLDLNLSYENEHKNACQNIQNKINYYIMHFTKSNQYFTIRNNTVANSNNEIYLILKNLSLNNNSSFLNDSNIIELNLKQNDAKDLYLKIHDYNTAFRGSIEISVKQTSLQFFLLYEYFVD